MTSDTPSTLPIYHPHPHTKMTSLYHPLSLFAIPTHRLKWPLIYHPFTFSTRPLKRSLTHHPFAFFSTNLLTPILAFNLSLYAHSWDCKTDGEIIGKQRGGPRGSPLESRGKTLDGSLGATLRSVFSHCKKCNVEKCVYFHTIKSVTLRSVCIFKL